MNRFVLFLCGVCLCAIPGMLSAQTNPLFYDYPQNHLKWYTIESDHFLIHYQEGSSRSAQVVSRIAEEIYKPITDLYDLEPDQKVSIVLKDREDYANGAAYFFDNKIDIWLPALDTPLRGTHDWLRNVIAHEFTHIVQIQKAMRKKRTSPVSYVQWLNYEEVRRPDVLYGFPNGIVTHPFVGVNVPAWLAEGTAQYQRTGLNYDTWDAHRDMILRTRILSDTYLNLDQMGTFASKTSIERETVYNQGYAFVIYMANRFGEIVLRDISAALSEKGTYNVADAIEKATGIPGYELFDQFIEDRTRFYKDATSNMNLTRSDYLEPEGFLNFFAQPSPDGSSVAYVSNKGRDFSAVSLYITDGVDDQKVSGIDQLEFNEHDHHAMSMKPSILFLSSAFSWAPDGKEIAFSINRKNSYGELYRDLFLYNLGTKKQTRLTRSERIDSPVFNPAGTTLAAIRYRKGTQNLVLFDLATKEITPLTTFGNGETMYTPVWSPDGTAIYFASAMHGPRDIYRYDLGSGAITPILAEHGVDYRDPFITKDGRALYYSADPDGIFNIYRMDFESSTPEKVTSVLGGAFMPNVDDSGRLFFSEYEASGYKIKYADMSLGEPVSLGFYDPAVPETGHDHHDHASDIAPIPPELLEYDDTDLTEIPADLVAIADTGSTDFTISSPIVNDARTLRSYTDTYTSFSFFPVLRFDNYSALNGNNGRLLRDGQFGLLGENLLRDVKPGFYFASRDVTDRLSIFGGFLLGVASRPTETIGGFFAPNRLLDLDRDAFIIIEQRGLPFIKKSWSPTVSVELYNLRRNVADGLTIEEFPCTSCLPDTTTTDIAFDIWEADLFLRSKLSRRSLLELGLRYSPFRVSTENFFSRELNQLIAGSSSRYFIGTTLSAAYTFDYYMYSRDADIAPIGLRGYLRYQYQPSRLLDEFEIRDGALTPIYQSVRNHSAEMQVRYGFRLANDQAFQARVRGFSYFNNPGDFFFLDYVGGFLGMRSYPFFAIGGTTTGFASLSYFLPLYRNINKQVGPYSLDKLYARFFFETGNGWYLNDPLPGENDRLEIGNDLKSGIGTELRFSLNGYYLFPLRFFVSAAYGFNQFSLTLPEEFLTGSDSNNVTYGRELLFHFGLTFDFDL
ncbi:MAG: hypothetical protein AAFW89_04095, partial [Bacteroidota bacterium]